MYSQKVYIIGIGDLVELRKIFSDKKIYAKVVDILDENDVTHLTCNLVVQHNQLRIICQPICNLDLTPINSLKDAIGNNQLSKHLDNGLLEVNTSIVYALDIDDSIKELESDIKKIQSKIEFLNLHRNRHDKINKILNP